MPKTLDECRKQFPSAWEVDVGGASFVVRKPVSIEWRAFKGAQVSVRHMPDGGAKADGAGILDAMEVLAVACCVSHNPAELATYADDYLEAYSELGAEIIAHTEREMAARSKKRAPNST